MGKKIITNILTFIAIFAVVNLVFSFFNGGGKNEATPTNAISIVADKEVPEGKLVTVKIENTTASEATFQLECFDEPLDVYQFKNNEWTKESAKTEINRGCTEPQTIKIEPGKTYSLAYEQWNHALFGELGRYKIEGKFMVNGEEKTVSSNEFEVTKPNIFRFLWTHGFYQPVYNIAMFFVSVMPGHNLGLAIIVLTIFIRLLLLVPSQKALKSQRRMQELQPKLNEIKEKYKNDQAKVAEETMKIWKENKVSPFGSCLPLLIQFPILIALFYAVKTGLNPDNSYLLYKGFVNVPFQSINVNFLGLLDLTERNLFWLPLIVGLLQFAQMKMTFIKSKKGEKKSDTDMVNNTMIYFMPVMIAVFTASVPSAVGLYWATSTIFAVAQQYFVNKPKGESM